MFEFRFSLDPEAKRQSKRQHVDNEKERRKEIADIIDELRNLVPDLRPQTLQQRASTTPQVEVLRRARDYIKSLQAENFLLRLRVDCESSSSSSPSPGADAHADMTQRTISWNFESAEITSVHSPITQEDCSESVADNQDLLLPAQEELLYGDDILHTNDLPSLGDFYATSQEQSQINSFSSSSSSAFASTATTAFYFVCLFIFVGSTVVTTSRNGLQPIRGLSELSWTRFDSASAVSWLLWSLQSYLIILGAIEIISRLLLRLASQYLLVKPSSKSFNVAKFKFLLAEQCLEQGYSSDIPLVALREALSTLMHRRVSSVFLKVGTIVMYLLVPSLLAKQMLEFQGCTESLVVAASASLRLHKLLMSTVGLESTETTHTLLDSMILALLSGSNKNIAESMSAAVYALKFSHLPILGSIIARFLLRHMKVKPEIVTPQETLDSVASTAAAVVLSTSQSYESFSRAELDSCERLASVGIHLLNKMSSPSSEDLAELRFQLAASLFARGKTNPALIQLSLALKDSDSLPTMTKLRCQYSQVLFEILDAIGQPNYSAQNLNGLRASLEEASTTMLLTKRRPHNAFEQMDMVSFSATWALLSFLELQASGADADENAAAAFMLLLETTAVHAMAMCPCVFNINVLDAIAILIFHVIQSNDSIHTRRNVNKISEMAHAVVSELRRFSSEFMIGLPAYLYHLSHYHLFVKQDNPVAKQIALKAFYVAEEHKMERDILRTRLLISRCSPIDV